MNALTEFLVARLREDESDLREQSAAKRAHERKVNHPVSALVVYPRVVDPDHLLNSCIAEQRIVELLSQPPHSEWAQTVLGLLAARYSSHEGFRGEWLPDHHVLPEMG